MSGLSETERTGCATILTLMSAADVHSLTDTVTNKLIVVENTTGRNVFIKRKKAAELICFAISYSDVLLP